jgi:hypothetical protein
VVNRYGPKAYLEKQKEGSNLVARTGLQKQADSKLPQGALDSTSSGSLKITQNSLRKIEGGVLETENLTQQILNQNPNLTNCGNKKLGHQKGFASMPVSPYVSPVVVPANNRKSFASFFPNSPLIPVRNSETPFFDVDNHRNSISTQNYQQTPQSYQQTPQSYQQTPQSYQQTPQSYQQTPQSYQQAPQSYQQAPQSYQQAPQSYQPQYQDSFYAQPHSYAPEANEYYYYYDYKYVQDQSSSQYGSKNSQDQSQQQQEHYYTEDCYTVPGNYYAAEQNDQQNTNAATQANVNSYATGYQTYPAQTGQLSNSQGNWPQGYVTPTQQNGYPVQGQYMSY